MVHISCMQGIGIAEKCLAFFQVKGVLVDFIEHFTFFYISELYLRMPVPQKRSGFISGKTFIAYQARKCTVAVLFQFFSGCVGDDLHEKRSPFF